MGGDDLQRDDSYGGAYMPKAIVAVVIVVLPNLLFAGALFFGLWLIPMGWCVLRSGWMPRWRSPRRSRPSTCS